MDNSVYQFWVTLAPEPNARSGTQATAHISAQAIKQLYNTAEEVVKGAGGDLNTAVDCGPFVNLSGAPFDLQFSAQLPDGRAAHQVLMGIRSQIPGTIVSWHHLYPADAWAQLASQTSNVTRVTAGNQAQR